MWLEKAAKKHAIWLLVLAYCDHKQLINCTQQVQSIIAASFKSTEAVSGVHWKRRSQKSKGTWNLSTRNITQNSRTFCQRPCRIIHGLGTTLLSLPSIWTGNWRLFAFSPQILIGPTSYSAYGTYGSGASSTWRPEAFGNIPALLIALAGWGLAAALPVLVVAASWRGWGD